MYCYKYAAIQMVKQGRGGRILGLLAHFPVITINTHLRDLPQELHLLQESRARPMQSPFPFVF